MEYITRKEFEKLKEHGYTDTLKEFVSFRESYFGENLRKLYEDLGYNVEKDMMILALDEKDGTILKPVRIIEE